ncbi:probable 4-coumarate--CoA ligase 1 [Culicoides brevitarsis]|uniref:probable 4-coumarate--CoA ligase 1 n=1 Tax=Culicoides brevitarsis TaxID=469753 RepID=UPI00307C766B
MSSYNPETKIWSSKGQPSIYNPKASLGELVLHSLKRNPDKVCEISDDYGTQLTFSELMKRSIQVAEALKEDYGVKFGDVVSIVSKNNPEVSSVVFGCIFNGCVINSLDMLHAQIDFDHLIGLMKPKFVFVEVEVIEKVQSAINKHKLDTTFFCFTDINGKTHSGITPVRSFFEKVLDFKVEDYLPAFVEDTSKQIAFIMCSSGSTDVSKGVCLSHAQIISQASRLFEFYEYDITYVSSTLYGITGFANLLRATIEGATRINSTKPVNPELFFYLIKKYKVSFTFVTPALIAQCLDSSELSNANLSSVTRCYTGGSLLLGELQISFEKHLINGKLVVCYGMTETATASTRNSVGKPGSVGILQNETKMKIVSSEGKLLGPNEQGEICISSSYLCLGYYGEEEKTKKLFDKDGWICSGDLGYFDEEGYLFIVGRIKELIIYKGAHIAPGSIEKLVKEYTGLSQVCAVPIEDYKQGTELPAVVVIRPKDFPLSQEEIVKVLDEKLDYKRKLLGGVYFVDIFPQTATGKVLRRELKVLANRLYLSKKQNDEKMM